MKKIYFALGALLFSASFGFSQVEIRVYDSGVESGNDISGSVHTVTVSEDGMHDVHLAVRNVSGADKELKISRLRISEVSGWTDGLCWGPVPDPDFNGQCYGSSQMSTNPWLSPSAMTITNNGIGELKPQITTNGPGTALYRYYVVEGATTLDSIDVQVTSVLSIDEKTPAFEMSAYPNPVNGTLTVTSSGLNGGGELRITDVLGKVVYTDNAVNAINKVDVSSFKNGVYLVTILQKGEAVQTRRVVVKH